MRLASFFILFFSAFAIFTGANAATLTINAREEAGNVIFEASGSIDLTGLTKGAFVGSANGLINPNAGTVRFAPTGSGDLYVFAGQAAPVFGTGGAVLATSVSGDTVTVSNPGGVARIGLPTGYVSLTALVATMTFESATFMSLGITPGQYEVMLNASNTLIYNFGATEVPLPAAFPLFIAGLAGLGFARRKASA